nr:HNH homing endonuclease [Marseillevirus sp.]
MCDCGEEEIWKPIERCEYEVSSCGRVRDEAKKAVPVVVLKERGCHVRLPGKHVRTARLVASSFVPNPENMKYVKRKDGKEQNNHASNLFWSNNPTKDGKTGSKPNPDFLPVEQYTLENVFVRSWDGPKEAAEKHGGITSQVRRCCEGMAKTFAGYKWKWGVDPDLEGEIWKDCDLGVKKVRKVSNMGRLLLDSGAKTYGRKDGRGYLLYAGLRVHRLVADAFCVGELTKDMVVNHKNSKKDDNRAENLEICSPSWNTRHSFMKPQEVGDLETSVFDGEEWTEIKGIRGYEISNMGRIRGPEEKYLLCRKSKQGLIVSLKGKSYRMKHLVADAFIPNPEKKKNVHCIDGNQENVCMGNLQRCNRGEEIGLGKRAKKKKDTIVKFSPEGEEIAEYKTFDEAVKDSEGILKTPLNKIVSSDNRKEYGGFVWRYRSVVDFPGEEWKDAFYKEKKYNVSSCGRILTERDRKTFGGPNNQGYMTYKNELVHRIVATAFLPPPLPSQTIINHISGERDNNRVENLEWCTPSANSRHAHETGLISLTSREEFRNKEI